MTVLPVVYAVIAIVFLLFGFQLFRRYCTKPVTVFLSYRVRTDADLAARFHALLTERNVNVWWDKVCLQDGADWEEGFVDGLFSSRVFVPLLSKAALAPYATLHADSPCDNMMLEQLLALEQMQRREMHAIFPIFLGEADADTGLYSDFYDVNASSMPVCTAQGPVNTVDATARVYLNRKQGQMESCEDEVLLIEDRSPRSGILDKLVRFQGGFVKGEVDEALEELADRIAALATRLSRFGSSPPAEGEDGGGPRSWEDDASQTHGLVSFDGIDAQTSGQGSSQPGWSLTSKLLSCLAFGTKLARRVGLPCIPLTAQTADAALISGKSHKWRRSDSDAGLMPPGAPSKPSMGRKPKDITLFFNAKSVKDPKCGSTAHLVAGTMERRSNVELTDMTDMKVLNPVLLQRATQSIEQERSRQGYQGGGLKLLLPPDDSEVHDRITARLNRYLTRFEGVVQPTSSGDAAAEAYAVEQRHLQQWLQRDSRCTARRSEAAIPCVSLGNSRHTARRSEATIPRVSSHGALTAADANNDIRTENEKLRKELDEMTAVLADALAKLLRYEEAETKNRS